MQLRTSRLLGIAATVAALAAGVAVTAGCGPQTQPEAAANPPNPATVSSAPAEPGGRTTVPAATPSPAATAGTGKMLPALTPNLRYQTRGWGVVGGNEGSGIGVQAPAGWRFVQLGDFHAKLSGAGDVWSLRVNGAVGDPPTSQSATLDAKLATLRSATNGFDLVSRSAGRTTSVYGSMPYTYTTLVYRYTASDGTTRIVLDRWIDDSGAATDNAWTEIVVSGRPLDSAGLRAVMEKATRTLVRAG